MKRFCAITVILGILVSMIVLPVYAQSSDKWNGTSIDVQWSGDGTEEKPYLITSASELYGLAKNVYDSLSTDADVMPTDTEGVYTKYSGTYFKLTCDIDLDNHNWLPIGRIGMRFNGVFDGDGHIIKNLSIIETVYQGMGLFGATSEDTLIENIGIDNALFEYEVNSNVAVDYKTDADVNESFTIALDKGRPWGTAALIGVFDGGTVRNCYARNVAITNTDTDTPQRNGGGLLGGAYSTTAHTDSLPTREINVTSCYVKDVVITGEFEHAGAFFGSTRRNSTDFLYGNLIKAYYCYAAGNISTQSAFGDGRCSGNNLFFHCYVTQETTRNTEATLTDMAGILKIFSTRAPGYCADNASTPVNDGYPVLTWQNTWSDLWDGKTTDRVWEGNGTEENPYIIATAEELAGLAYNVNNAVSGDGNTVESERTGYYSVYKDTYFKLANDIDLTGSNWTPIGATGTNFFDGCFDGDSHVIKNLTMTEKYNRMALFGRTGTNVVIKNLGLEGVTIEYINVTGSNRVTGAASLIAQSGGGLIEKCYARDVKIINHATDITEYAEGGLVAYCDAPQKYVDTNSDIRFNNCYVENVEISGSVSARHSAFFGRGYSGYLDYRRYPKFKNCCVIGDVLLSNGTCYGFGSNDQGANAINCFSVSDIGIDETHTILTSSTTLDEIKAEYSVAFLSIPHSWSEQYDVPKTSIAGCPISWSSSDTSVIDNDITAYYAKESRTAILTATVTSGDVQKSKKFEVTLPGKQVFEIKSATFTNADGTTSNSLSAGATLTGVNIAQNYTAQNPKIWIGLYDAKNPDKRMKEVCMADAVPDTDGNVAISNGFVLPETDIDRYLVRVMIWSDYTQLCDNFDVFAPATENSRFTISGSSHAAFTQTPDYQYTVSTDDAVVWSIEGNVPRTVKMSSDGILSLTEEIVDDTIITIKAALKNNAQIYATKTVLLSTAEDYAKDTARFEAAKTVLDNTLAYGKTSNSPLISNYINISDKAIQNYPAVEGDIPLTNLAMQFNLMTALSGMSNLTGDSKYQDAVDEIYSYHMENLFAPTNMFYWGGHCSLNMNTIEPEPYTYEYYGSLHELKDTRPYLEPFFRLYPEESKKIAMGAWMGHIVDWSTFAFNRHASLKYENDSDIWDDVDNIEIEPGLVRWANDCGFRSSICDIMNMAMDDYEATGDTIPLKWTYKMLQKYISTSYNYENGGRIFGGVINTAHNAPNVIDIEEEFGEDWWTDENYKTEMGFATYGDRYYNQFAQSLYEAGLIEEWEKEYIIDPYNLNGGCEGVILAMSAIRCAELMQETHPEQASTLVDDMVQHLYQYYSMAYDWDRNWFPAMTITGKIIEGFTPERNGYYGKNPLTGLNPKYFHVLSAAMVYEAASKRPELMEKYSEELEYIWAVAEDISRDRLLLGDIGNPFTGEAPSLNMETSRKTPEYIRLLIKLYELTGNFDYLDCARQVADNIVANNIKDGFMVQESNQTVSLTGDDYISEILYLESYLTGNEDAVPVTFLPSDQYYDGYVKLSDGTITLAGEEIFTKYDEYLE